MKSNGYIEPHKITLSVEFPHAFSHGYFLAPGRMFEICVLDDLNALNLKNRCQGCFPQCVLRKTNKRIPENI